MKILNTVSEKLQQMLGENYAIIPLTNFNRNYTEAREYIDGDNVSYFRYYNSDYGKFRKDKVVGVVTLINPTRSNVKGYYLASSYKIDFSVPRNIVKTNKYNEEIEEQKFNFDDDIENFITNIINRKINFSDNLIGKLSMSDPVYISSENDGEFQYDIMQVTGNIVLSDNAKFGSDYKVEILVNDEYVEIDDINSFSETLNNQNNAIIKHDKTKVEQNLAQLSWGCVVVIDDFMSDNLARKKLYDIIHLNQEILNEQAETEALKRKLRVRITTPNGKLHIFNAIVNITFTTTKNGVGTYSITFTDDNKPFLTYILSFDSNGGSHVQSKKILYGAEIGELIEPIKVGYTYDGWEIDGEKINSETIYDYHEDKVATTNWVANKYFVEFNANGGVGQVSRQQFIYDIKQELDANVFTRENYTFIGWSTNKSGTQAMYTNNQEVINLTDINNGVIILYAVWEKNAPIPTISINKSGRSAEIIINSEDSTFDIYYILSHDSDGYPSTTYPMPAGTLYTEPITVSSNENQYYHIQAVTRKNGKESGMAVATFNIEIPKVNYRIIPDIDYDNTADVDLPTNITLIIPDWTVDAGYLIGIDGSTTGYPETPTPNISNVFEGWGYTGESTASNQVMYWTTSIVRVVDGISSDMVVIKTKTRSVLWE